MGRVFGSIQHLIAASNKEQVAWCAAIVAVMIVLAILHHVWREDEKKISLWRCLCLIPLLIGIAHFVVCVLPITWLISDYTAIYVIAALSLIPIIFAKRRIGYRISAGVVGVVTAAVGSFFCLTAPNSYNHARMDYTDSFHAFVQDMDKHYVLKEWKEIDFAALEANYMPMIEAAEQEQNPTKFYDAVDLFCSELHDGHVYVGTTFDPEEYPERRQMPHEYGLAMVRLDNDEVIAVCTSDDVQQLGIKDGTVITKWDGKPVLQAAGEIRDPGYPVKANWDRLMVMRLACTGGDSVDVSFLDDAGKEQNVTLGKQQTLHTFREAMDLFIQYPPASEDEESYENSNFSTKMLTDKCGYLRVLAEGTDNGVQDILGYLNGDHKWAREMFREKLRDLKAQGMEYLVIDLRNNCGGLDEIGCALTDLFTTQEYGGCNPGTRKNGQYIINSEHKVWGDGEFADMQVVALTN